MITRTNGEPDGELGANQGSNSTQRGVRKLKPREGRPKPYGVQWRTDGKVKTEFYADTTQRDKRYAGLVREARRGNLAQVPDRSDMADWYAFKKSINDTPWQDVVAGWRADLQHRGVSLCDLLVKDAVTTYMAEMEKAFFERRLSDDTIRHKRQKIGLFSDTFGSNRLDAVRGEDIEEWLEEDLGLDVAATFNTYRRHLRSFFSFFGKQIRSNPLDDVKPLDERIEHVGILTVRETAQLFDYALHNQRAALGRLALEAFAGLRFSSAYRLEKNDINFVDRGISLPAQKIKTQRRHYIDGLPQNLWSWLEATTPDCWSLTQSEWMHMKSELFENAKVGHPHNCLRHSFCTYHMAAFKNPGLTATLLCHSNQQKLWSNYNGRATQADGKKYWTITPQTVADLVREEK